MPKLTEEDVRREVAEFHVRQGFGSTPADAFPAWWLYRRYRVSPADAIARAPGGAHDLGLDAFHLDANSDEPSLRLIQGKFTSTKALVKSAFHDFERLIPELRATLLGVESGAAVLNPLFGPLKARLAANSTLVPTLRLRFEVVHLCDTEGEVLESFLESTIDQLLDKAQNAFPSRICTARHVNAVSELSPLGERERYPSETFPLRFAGEEVAGEPGVNYFAGIGFLADLVSLYEARGEALFERNVRYFLYRTQQKGPAAYFGEADHSFRTKAITRFGPRRSVISVQGDHACRSMPITA